MSIALDPVTINDLTPSANGPTSTAQLIVDPNRISAVRVFNNTPFTMKITDLPGNQQVWLPPYQEDIYRTNFDNPAFYSSTKGFISLTPFNFSIRNNDTAPSTGSSRVYTPYKALITIYELGDDVPSVLGPPHAQMTSIVGESLNQTSFVNNAVFTAASAGSLNIGVADIVTASSTILYYCILSGFSIDFQASTAQHNFTLNITGISGGAINISCNIPATTPYSVFRGPLYWISNDPGGNNHTPNNTITISVPAITGGPAYSITMWGYGERTP